MFTVKDREHARERVLEMARQDSRIVAGAVVGSLAFSEGDRWSDLDLTFAVAEDAKVDEVLADSTKKVKEELDAAHLFDLTAGPSIYRVFLLPGCLQFDLSFTPASQFGAIGPKFKLLFGTAGARPHPPPPPASDLFGYAVHHLVRGRICIERGRYWQAEYWISAARDYALSVACRLRVLSSSYGRGFDDLPGEVRARFVGSLPISLEREALLVALKVVIEGIIREVRALPDGEPKMEKRLRELVHSPGAQ